MKSFSISRVMSIIFIVIVLFILIPHESINFSSNDENLIRAEVLAIENNSETSSQIIKVRIEEGELKGKEFVLENTLMLEDKILSLNINDEVTLISSKSGDNSIDLRTYEYVRENKLMYLVVAFIILVLIVSGIKVIYAILSVFFTIAIVFMVLIPRLLKGDNPIIVTIICSLLIAFFSLIVQHGVTKKSISSLVGTIGGIIISGIVTIIMSNSLHVIINTEDTVQLLRLSENIRYNFQQLLFAGIVIGALGANIDMSMSVASAMNEIKVSNRRISNKEFIRAGMNVGKDVIGTMTNTLVLAYVGSTLTTLMIFFGYSVSFTSIINLHDISIEILRSLAGSIGIILCVPLTVITRVYIENSNIRE